MNETNQRVELYIRNRDVLSHIKWERKQVGEEASERRKQVGRKRAIHLFRKPARPV